MRIRFTTLNQYIAALQEIAAEHGEKELESVGSACGMIEGLQSPHTLRLRDSDGYALDVYVRAFQHVVK